MTDQPQNPAIPEYPSYNFRKEVKLNHVDFVIETIHEGVLIAHTKRMGQIEYSKLENIDIDPIWFSDLLKKLMETVYGNWGA